MAKKKAKAAKKPVKKTKAAPKAKPAKKKTAKAAKPAPKAKAKPKTAKKAKSKAKAAPKAKTKPAPKTKAKAAPKTKPVAKPRAKAPAEPAWTQPAETPSEPSVPMPRVGDQAPDFQLAADDGGTLSLADFAGRPVVLYFYPKADTPGCTKEACAFQADLGTFNAIGATVVGVSPDDASALQRFRRKYNLDFPLAGDAGAEVAKRYGVWVEKNMYGRRYMGIQRATFLIGKDGRIAAAWPKVSVEGHSREVLQAVQNVL